MITKTITIPKNKKEAIIDTEYKDNLVYSLNHNKIDDNDNIFVKDGTLFANFENKLSDDLTVTIKFMENELSNEDSIKVTSLLLKDRLDPEQLKQEELATLTTINNKLNNVDSLKQNQVLEYAIDTAYVVNDYINYENNIYKVIQSHISQEDWKPNITTSLYSIIISQENYETLEETYLFFPIFLYFDPSINTRGPNISISG